MSTIKTVDDWWRVTEDCWPHLVNIMERFLPMGEFQNLDGTLLGVPLREYVTTMFERRDADIPRILNAAWGAAPDQPSIHSIPRWNVLCDLCSEEWVFEENEPCATKVKY